MTQIPPIGEEIEQLLVGIRADTGAFAKDVAAMQSQIDGPFAAGLERAGSLLEKGLSRALLSGNFGLEQLKKTALSIMAEIAEAAINSGLNAMLSGGTGTGGLGSSGGNDGGGHGAANGLLQIGSALIGSLLGLPGRATGGLVSGGRAYAVGESGPEIFVPTAAGRITPAGGSFGADRPPAANIRMTINISDHGHGSAPTQLRRSSRQVARAVRGALSAKAD